MLKQILNAPCMTVIWLLMVTISVQAITITVDDNGPADLATISAAIAVATDGDTIHVAPGTYTERLSIGKSISLIGSGRDITRIEFDGDASAVSVNSGANVTIEGIEIAYTFAGTITGAFRAALLTSQSTLTVRDSRITGMAMGVRATNSTVKLISDEITLNTRSGISLSTGVTAQIEDNLISGNGDDGIETFSGAHLTVVTGNTINGNANRGISINDSTVDRLTDNVIRNNLDDGIVSFSPNIRTTITDLSQNQIHNNMGRGISLNETTVESLGGNRIFANIGDTADQQRGDGIGASDGTIITRLTGNQIFANAARGISLNATTITTIASNLIFDNGDGGIHALTTSQVNTIDHNTIVNNLTRGIRLSTDSSVLEVTNNIIMSHEWGIALSAGGSAPSLVPAHNNLFNHSQGDYGAGITPGTLDQHLDPVFFDSPGGDFHLQPTSPMIGIGENRTDIGALPALIRRLQVFGSPAKPGDVITVRMHGAALSLVSFDIDAVAQAVPLAEISADVYQGEYQVIADDLGVDIPLVLRVEATDGYVQIDQSHTVTLGEFPSLVWESDIGTELIGLTGTDDHLESLALGFDFPFFGVGYREVFVSTNGLIILREPSEEESEDNNLTIPAEFMKAATRFGFASDFRNAPAPVIAPFFSDMDLTSRGKVSYNTFESRTVITWSKVASFTYPLSSFSFQVQLMADGRIIFAYNGIGDTTTQLGKPLIVGISVGGNGNAASTDFSDGHLFRPTLNSSAYQFELEPRQYERFDPSTGAFDLDSSNVVFIPSPADTKIGIGAAPGLDATKHLAQQMLNRNLIIGDMPQATQLLTNYPNPFNPETWIPYELAVDVDVTIDIYSVNGQRVRQLDLGFQSRGRYTRRDNAAYWDGRNDFGGKSASGVYFYVFTAGDYIKTKKMIIGK